MKLYIPEQEIDVPDYPDHADALDTLGTQMVALAQQSADQYNAVLVRLAELAEAVEALQPAPPHLFPLRGVRTWPWDDPAECDARLDCFEAAGVNVIYLACYYSGRAYYNIDLMPWRFDALGYVLPRAHDRGMKVSALLPVAMMGWQEHPEWNALPALREGGTENWLDFGNEAARAWIRDVVREIHTNYAVDEILLDYIRGACKFVDGAIPADAVTATVASVADSLPADVTLAASVFAGRAWGIECASQPWYDWLEQGYLSYVTPMAYFEGVSDAAFWGQLTAAVNEWKGSGLFPARILPRLSVRRAEVLEHIDWCYAAGATGMTLWNDSDMCADAALVEALGGGAW